MTTQNEALWGKAAQTTRECQDAKHVLDMWATQVDARRLDKVKKHREHRETLLEALVFTAGAGCFYIMLLCIGAWR